MSASLLNSISAAWSNSGYYPQRFLWESTPPTSESPFWEVNYNRIVNPSGVVLQKALVSSLDTGVDPPLMMYQAAYFCPNSGVSGANVATAIIDDPNVGQLWANQNLLHWLAAPLVPRSAAGSLFRFDDINAFMWGYFHRDSVINVRVGDPVRAVIPSEESPSLQPTSVVSVRNSRGTVTQYQVFDYASNIVGYSPF